MNKTITLSISLLLSSAAYAGKIQEKAFLPNQKQQQITQDEMTEKNSVELTSEEEKTEKEVKAEPKEKPTWGFFDKLQHITKSNADKVIIALEQDKLDLEDKEGTDYTWLATTILNCTEKPNIEKLIAIYALLKQKNELPKEQLNKVVRTFLDEQIEKGKETLADNLISLMSKLQKTITPLLQEIDDMLEKDLNAVKELDSAKDLTVEKVKEREKQDKLTDEKIWGTHRTSFIKLLANIQQEVSEF